MIDVLIILQTHANSNASSSKRYVEFDKHEISKRCYLSLVRTIKHCKKMEPEVNYRLIILDDKSNDEFVNFIKDSISKENLNIEFRKTKNSGIMPSIGEMYGIGRAEGKNLVYFAQDDYLYYETALWEMIDSFFKFTKTTGMNVCIYPFDDPFRYTLNYPCRILLGANRHWKNSYHTACCFMVSHETILENWDLFDSFKDQTYDSYCEDRTINRLFQQMQSFPKRDINHLLFTPIPSLALHLQDESTKDPYLDWRSLWNQFSSSH